jgi:threonine/homoserine/homoserine lactone efflux protein
VHVIVTTLAVYLAVVVAPGPNFLVVTRLAAGRSRMAGMAAALGIAVGATTYAVATMVGLAAVLDRVGWLARGIQVAGGCYLVYLGLSAWRRRAAEANGHPVDARRRTEQVAGLRSGVLVSLSNPKAIAFFVGLYAAMIPADASAAVRLAILAGGFVIEVGWYSAVALALSLSAPRRVYRRVERVIERVVGSVLALLGARLATSG